MYCNNLLKEPSLSVLYLFNLPQFVVSWNDPRLFKFNHILGKDFIKNLYKRAFCKALSHNNGQQEGGIQNGNWRLKSTSGNHMVEFFLMYFLEF